MVTICWPGGVLYSFVHRNNQIHGHRCRIAECGFLLLQPLSIAGFGCRQRSAQHGPAASLASSVAVLWTLGVPTVITSAKMRHIPTFGYRSASRFQLCCPCLSSAAFILRHCQVWFASLQGEVSEKQEGGG